MRMFPMGIHSPVLTNVSSNSPKAKPVQRKRTVGPQVVGPSYLGICVYQENETTQKLIERSFYQQRDVL